MHEWRRGVGEWLADRFLYRGKKRQQSSGSKFNVDTSDSIRQYQNFHCQHDEP